MILSTASGLLYAILRSDVSTGISLASYSLTALSVGLAFVAAGEWLGLPKPDGFAFAYSIDQNRIVGASHVKRIIGRRYEKLHKRGQEALERQT